MKNLAKCSVIFFLIFSYGVMMSGDIPAAASEDQKAAISEIEKTSSKDVTVKWDERRGVAKFISGQLTGPSDKSKTDLSIDFIRQHKVLFGVENPDKELALDNTNAASRGRFINFRQKKDGLDVIGGKITVRIENGIITTVANYFEPNITVKTTPTISLEEATAIARREINSPQQTDTGSLVVFHWEGKCYLSYRIDFRFNPGPEPSRYRVYINAHDGTIILIENRVMHAGSATGSGIGVDGNVKSFDTYEKGGAFYLGNAPLSNTTAVTIKTYTANNTKSLPGSIMKDSNNSWDDPAGVDAHFYGNYVFDFYKNNFSDFSWFVGSGFDSSHGLVSTVHYDTAYENAFWNETQMVYGDGGQTFLPFSGSLDVVAHEITHGVTQAINDLIYGLEPGALNESWSDVMGMFTSLDYGDDRPYWMAEDIMKIAKTPGKEAYYALRRMDDPPFKTDSYPENNYNPNNALNSWGQPEHTSEQYRAANRPWTDYGGVHINSGIPNKAAYLITTNTNVGAEKAKQIYYDAMFYLSANSQFVDARDAVEQATIDLYGRGKELIAVQAAFNAVGIQ